MVNLDKMHKLLELKKEGAISQQEFDDMKMMCLKEDEPKSDAAPLATGQPLPKARAITCATPMATPTVGAAPIGGAVQGGVVAAPTPQVMMTLVAPQQQPAPAPVVNVDVKNVNKTTVVNGGGGPNYTFWCFDCFCMGGLCRSCCPSCILCCCPRHVCCCF